MTGQTEVVTNVACTLCGCLCDDLQVTVKENRVSEVRGACDAALPWFQNLSGRDQATPQLKGERASLDECLAKASDLIKKSSNPLVFGLSKSGTAGQRAACELADFSGAVIDSAATEKSGSSSLAVQRIGESTASLGEVKLRSDLIVFWQTDPVDDLPRFMERFVDGTVRDPSDGSSRERFFIVVDSKESRSSELADLFIQIDPGKDFEVLWALRGLVNGIECKEQTIGGVEHETLKSLAKHLTSSQYGAIFYGKRLINGNVPHMNIEALLSLAADLHQHTRCVVRKVRGFGDPLGAENVLGWQTGYPFAVSLNRRYPRYNPGEFSGHQLIDSEEPDLLIVLGTHGLGELAESAAPFLSDTPSILLTYSDEGPGFLPTVQIPVKTYGVHTEGTAYRLDETPIPLRPFLKSDLPTDEEVLNHLTRQLQESSSDC